MRLQLPIGIETFVGLHKPLHHELDSAPLVLYEAGIQEGQEELTYPYSHLHMDSKEVLFEFVSEVEECIQEYHYKHDRIMPLMHIEHLGDFWPRF